MIEVGIVIVFQEREYLGRDVRGPSGSILLLELVGGLRATCDNSLSSYFVCYFVSSYFVIL